MISLPSLLYHFFGVFTMKLPNKTGTVYKLSGKRRHPWIARAYDGKDEFGVRKYKTIGYYKTKAEATRVLLAFVQNPYDLDKRKLTFGQVFQMVREEKAKDLKPTTLASNYDKIYRVFFMSVQDEAFADLRPVHYQKIFDELSAKGRKKSYLKGGKTLLHVMYTFAITNDIIQVDYSKGITNRGSKTENQPFFTRDEVLSMIGDLNKNKRLTSVLTMCLTGLRPSELLNVGKDTVDLEKKMIFNVGVKTSAGKVKRVPIADLIFPYIKKMYNECTNYLWEDDEGNALEYKYFLNNIYTPEVKRLGLPYKSPKSCRHTFANLTFGILNDKERTSMIGHTDVKLTNDVYTYLEDDRLKTSYEKVMESLTKV